MALCRSDRHRTDFEYLSSLPLSIPFNFSNKVNPVKSYTLYQWRIQEGRGELVWWLFVCFFLLLLLFCFVLLEMVKGLLYKNITRYILTSARRTYKDKAYTSPHLFGQFFNFRIFIKFFIHEVKKTSKFKGSGLYLHNKYQ